MPDDERAKLLDRFGRTFQAGETLYEEAAPADHCLLLRAGSVRLQKRIGSQHVYLTILHDGDLFGEEGLLEQGKRHGTAVAIADGALLALNKRTFSALLAGHPDVANKLVEQLVRRLQNVELQLENALLPDASVRIVHTLLQLADQRRLPAVGDETQQALLPIGPLELASRTLLEVDDVRRHLQKLQEQGFVHVEEQQVVLKHVPSLERLQRLLSMKEEVRGGFP